MDLGLFGKPILPESRKLTLVEQVTDILREEIQRERWRIGERLPSITELANESGISRWPIQKAFEALREDGYLRQEESRGTFLASLLPHGMTPLASIGVLTSFEEPFEPDRMQWRLHVLLNAIAARGYAAEVVTLKNHENLSEADREGALFSTRVRGVVSFCHFDRPLSFEVVPDRVPLVFFGGYSERVFPCVMADDRMAGYMLTERLIELGHCRIVCCMDRPSLEESIVGKVREEHLAGHVHAMEEAGLRADMGAARWVVETERPEMASSYLDAFADATAVICTRVDFASRLVAVAEARGLVVPRDLSVAAFFMDTMPVRQTAPAITCIDHQLGVQMEKCLDVLEEARRLRRYPASRILAPPILREGDSVAPPRRTAVLEPGLAAPASCVAAQTS